MDILCSSCKVANAEERYKCFNCGRPLVVGILESKGYGIIPKGVHWSIKPKFTTIGRHLSNDFVISDNALLDTEMSFQAGPNAQQIMTKAVSPDADVTVNGLAVRDEHYLRTGDKIRIGEDEFEFKYLIDIKGEENTSLLSLSEKMSFLTASMTEIQCNLDLDKCIHMGLHAVLGMLKMERAMMLMVEEDSEGDIEIAHAGFINRGSKQNEPNHAFSHSIVRQAYEKRHIIVVENIADSAITSDSISDMNLKFIFCMPLIVSERYRRKVIGFIYGDNVVPSSQVGDREMACLTSFSYIMANSIRNCQQHDMALKRIAELEKRLSEATGESVSPVSTETVKLAVGGVGDARQSLA